MKVLGIPGSLRRHSYNRRLLELARAHTPTGMSLSVVEHRLLASIPPFDEDLETEHGGDPDPVRRLRDQVRAADGLLVSTPEYNQSMPGVLKNHIDWLSRRRPDEVLMGKPAAVMGATSGEWGTRLAQSQVRQALTSTEALVLPPGVAIYLRRVDRLFAADEVGDPELAERLRRFMAAFGEWIARCRRLGASS